MVLYKNTGHMAASASNNDRLRLGRPLPSIQKVVYLVALSLTIFSSPITYAGEFGVATSIDDRFNVIASNEFLHKRAKTKKKYFPVGNKYICVLAVDT